MDINITSGVRVSGYNEQNVLKKVKRIEKNGTRMNWRMDKIRADKITSVLQRNIDRSHLYPMGMVVCASAVGEYVQLEFDAEKTTPQICKFQHLVLVLNGDSNDSALVISASFQESGRAVINALPKGVLSTQRLAKALVCFGPQNIDSNVDIEMLWENTAKFAKSKQKLQVLPTTFEKLQRMC